MTYVKIALFCEKTGFTDRAVRRKIQDGVWVQGQVWVKAPDGSILIHTEGYERWAAGAKAAA